MHYVDTGDQDGCISAVIEEWLLGIDDDDYSATTPQDRLSARTLDDLRAKRPLSPDARKRVDDVKRVMQLEIALVELRELRGATQSEIADTLGTPRPNVSRIEKEADVRLSTLERYVEALGGKLELHAVFDDADVKLTA